VNRRRFLQIVSSSAVSAYAFDLDRLLWVPGQKTIFIPPERKLIFASEVAAIELERVYRVVKELFDKDNILYKVLSDRPVYKHETGDYKTVQIYHGYKIGVVNE
jgi:hypothetical protein